jgi:hypothetical protein
MSVFTNDGNENRMRWDRSSRDFMEVWYATMSDPNSGLGIWLRYTMTAPKDEAADPYCELWGFVFDPQATRSFAAKTRHDIDRFAGPDGRDDGAIVRVGDAWLSENHLEGEVEAADGRTLSWSLDFEPAARCFQHIPAPLRRNVERRVSTLCSPNLHVPFTGTIKLDGEAIELSGAPGCQTHRWGRKHSLTWTWAHCSMFEEEPDAIFEGVAAKAKLGPFPAPTSTLLYLRYRGEDIPFNEMRWVLRAKSRYELPTWAFHARNERWRIVGAARSAPDKMVQLRYTDPDGTPRYCANSEIADLALELFERDGSNWKSAASLRSLGLSHLEFGRLEPFPDLPVAF